MWGISRLAENRLASQEGLCSMEIAGQLVDSLNAELNTICHLLALLEVHHILHISRIRVKLVM